MTVPDAEYSFDTDGSDQSGNGHDFVGGVIGAGHTAGGLISSLSLGGWAALHACTIMAWCKPSVLTGNALAFGFLDGSLGASSNSEFTVWYSRSSFGPAGVVQGNVRADSGLSAVGGTALTLNEWIHLAFAWDGANARMIQDGVTKGSQAKTGSTPGSLTLSAWAANGPIDDLRVFLGVSLTDEEIIDYMNLPVGYVPSEDPSWSLWDGSSEIPLSVTVWDGSSELVPGSIGVV